MKKSIVAVVAAVVLLIGVAAVAGDAPDLRGTWKVETIKMFSRAHGYKEVAAPSSVFVIEEQKGTLFCGEKKWTARGKEHSEGFNGAVTHRSEILISEFDDGFCSGELLSNDSMILHYVESGETARTMVYELKRVK
ncbi:hypothetical protein [Pseudodesulfovibrio senegalensis]|uniref:Lipocalin-like domain-containing protein n=1 Tax=Pseudodesulfovibrio senegalensis TaxID=1721087 RepID=A0A6N6N1W8_9BACT|nr:hypothetical protein [Pseudodesulfovibrio senegalensis]KAB1441894.1 hypothetical protein F8A88_09940 [Pseudodesulfovibrio senegalensis]